MKLKQLCEMFRFDQIHLHESKEGKLIAKTSKTLERFHDVEVLQCYCKIESGKGSNWARSYVYVFGSSVDINRIKQEVNHE